MISERTVHCPQGEISYTLTVKNVKNINLRVKSDGTVSVSAPPSAGVKYIDGFVASKYDFIVQSIKKLSERESYGKQSERADCEEAVFLGVRYRVEILHGEEDSVFAQGCTLTVKTYDDENTAYAAKLVRNWYINNTAMLFRRLNAEVYEDYRRKFKDIPSARLELKSMKSQWGCCHIRDRVIVMNTRLAAYPYEAVRYVFYHEYAHFIAADHSKRFYAVLDEMLPLHRKYSALLKQNPY